MNCWCTRLTTRSCNFWLWTSPLLLTSGPLNAFALVFAIEEFPVIFFSLVNQPVAFWAFPAGKHMQAMGTAQWGGHLQGEVTPWLVIEPGEQWPNPTREWKGQDRCLCLLPSCSCQACPEKPWLWAQPCCAASLPGTCLSQVGWGTGSSPKGK